MSGDCMYVGRGVFGACIEGAEYVWRLYLCREGGYLETV